MRNSTVFSSASEITTMTITVKKAIQTGKLVVSLPTVLIFYIAFFVSVFLKVHSGIDMMLYLMIGSLVVSWLWWSIAIVKWRAWAYKHVQTEDIVELRKAAIEAYLTYPDNSILKKTEIKTAAEKQAEEKKEQESGVEVITNQSPALNWQRSVLIFLVIALGIFLSNFFRN